MLGGGKYAFSREIAPLVHKINMGSVKYCLEVRKSLIIDETNVNVGARKLYIE